MRYLWLIAALVLTTWPACAQQSRDWTWCINNNHDYPADQAIKGCTAVIGSRRESRENRAIAFNNRGLAFYSKDAYDSAIADFTEAIRLNPRFAAALRSRANAYSDRDGKGDHDRAIAGYNESIRLDSNNPVAFNNRCDEFLIIGQVEAALRDCNESLRLRPNHANTLMHRGNAYLAAEKLDQALADYEAALRLNPKDEWSLYGRGLIKVKRGNSADGNTDIAAANAIEARIGEAFASRGIK